MKTLLLFLPIFLFTTVTGTNVRTARVALTNATAHANLLCQPEIIATFQQTTSATSLNVNLQVSNLNDACGDTTLGGRFSLDIYKYGHYIHDSSSASNTPTSTKQTAEYKFGTILTGVQSNVVNTASYDIVLNGVSLTQGEDSSVLGRTMALQYCSTLNSNSCTSLLVSGVIGKNAPSTSTDANVAGASSMVENGDATLYCAIEGVRGHAGGVSGSLIFSNEIDGATLHLQASGNSLQSGNTHKLSLHPYGGNGEDHITPINVLGHDEPLKHHNLPCSPHRRLGDLGNVVVRSTSTGDKAEYYARMKTFSTSSSSSPSSSTRLTDVVGAKCVLWSTPDVTCTVWSTGCTAIDHQRRVLAYGTVGLAPDGSGGRDAKHIQTSNIDYDCMSSIVRKVVAKIYPMEPEGGTAVPRIYGTASLVAPTTNQDAPTTLDVQLTGTPDATIRALSIQTTGDVGADGASYVFAPLDRLPGRPPSSTRRVGDLGDAIAEKPYGYGQLSTERGFSLDDSLRSVVGRAIAVHAHPFGSTASNPVIAWGIFGLANPGADTNVASPGQILANSGASATSVVCVFRTATNPNEATTSALTTDGRSHIRLTLVETHSTNGTTTLPAVLVEGEFSFSPSSPQNMQHSLEIHHYGDLVTEHVGDSYGTVPSKSSKKSFNQCPSTTTRMGFLGDVVNTGSGGSGGGVVTEYTALLPPGTSTLHSLVGRSCVLKSGPHGDSSRSNIAIGVIAIPRLEAEVGKQKTRHNVRLFEQINRTAAALANRLDCVHRSLNEYVTPTKNADNTNRTPGSTYTGLTGGMVALIVCLTVGSIGAVCGGVGWWYVHKKRQHVRNVLEEAKLIRDQVPSVAINPDYDVACPPPPEHILHQSMKDRQKMSRQLNGGAAEDAEDIPAQQGKPRHQRVASSRFNTTRRPISVQMRAMPSRSASGGGGGSGGASTHKKTSAFKPGHARSKTMSNFRRNKAYAQENARNLLLANVTKGKTLVELKNPKTGRPMSVQLGAPKNHHKKSRPVHPSVHLINPAFDVNASDDTWATKIAKGEMKNNDFLNSRDSDALFLSSALVEMPEMKNNSNDKNRLLV